MRAAERKSILAVRALRCNTYQQRKEESMSIRPVPRLRALRVVLLVVLPLLGITLGLLFIAPPAAFAPYQPWLQFAIDLVFSLWFLCSALFSHSRFAKALGTGQNTPLVRWLGQRGTRLFFLLGGLFFLTMAVGTLLRHVLV